uniref:Uncharacterized protein n=1 Tax=Nothobranchius furzeri TaxID=105023 RepID=A0A8C6MM02_NOTFU
MIAAPEIPSEFSYVQFSSDTDFSEDPDGRTTNKGKVWECPALSHTCM